MRKSLMGAAATVLALLLAFPAAAAPKAYTYDVTCGDQSWVVAAKGVPGFPEGGQSPLLLLGGHFEVWADGELADEWDQVPPPGLEPQLMECTVTGPKEPADFTLEVDPAYILATR